MKHVVLLSSILVASLLAGSLIAEASAKSLFIAGNVPLRGDIEVKAAPNGKIEIQQNSPDKLKVQTFRRGPASIVSASAP